MKVAFLSRMRERRLFLFLSSGGCKSAGTGMQKHKNLPWNFTEKTEAGTRKEEQAEAEISRGNKTLLSEPDA